MGGADINPWLGSLNTDGQLLLNVTTQHPFTAEDIQLSMWVGMHGVGYEWVGYETLIMMTTHPLASRQMCACVREGSNMPRDSAP